MKSPSQTPVFTVTQLSFAIKHALESTFPSVTLQGEISNWKPHTSGHLYFSLKDANAQISAVMYRSEAINLQCQPKNGLQVVVRGEINVYPQGGRYQIIVREIKPVGVGELLLKLEELKIKLHKMGWFRSEHKKPLPKFPKRIGVVTSPTGAAIQDMLNILTRRFSSFHLILNPVKVQGEGAAKEIAKAIEQFNQYKLVDVIIVGRGGGSIEDLWAFNEEIVAQAIFNSEIPIISAVGHETDHCIADYVADVRAPTPSAAAEIVIAEKAQQLKRLSDLRQRMKQTVCQLIRQDRHRLNGVMRQPVLHSPYALLGPWIQRIDDSRQENDSTIYQLISLLRIKIDSKRQLLQSLKPTAKLEHYQRQLENWEKHLEQAFSKKIHDLRSQLEQRKQLLNHRWQAKQNYRRAVFQQLQQYRLLDTKFQSLIKRKRELLENLKNSLDTVNPNNLLAKGYCILFSEKDQSAISSVQQVKVDQNISILLADGKLKSTITTIEPK